MKEKTIIILLSILCVLLFIASVYFARHQEEIIVNLKPVDSHIYDWRLDPVK